MCGVGARVRRAGPPEVDFGEDLAPHAPPEKNKAFCKTTNYS